MFRASMAAGSSRTGRLLAAMIAAAALGAPVASAAAAADRGGGHYRRGGDSHHGGGHYRGGGGHHGGHRSYGHHGHHGHGHYRHYGHGHHHHGSHLSFSFGFPIVFGDPCPPPVIYRRPVIVHEPAPVIVHQPPVIVQQPAPVIVQQQPPVQPVVVTAEQRPLPPQIVAPPTVPDTVPQDLSMQAFRSGGTIMVHISGVNTGGAYNTTLATGDLGLASPSVVLRNVQTSAVAGAPDTAFNVSLAINVPRPVTTVTVRFADEAHEIPIVDVPTTSG